MLRFIFVNFSPSQGVIFSVTNIVQVQFPYCHAVSEDPNRLALLLLCFKFLFQAIKKTHKNRSNISKQKRKKIAAQVALTCGKSGTLCVTKESMSCVFRTSLRSEKWN